MMRREFVKVAAGAAAVAAMRAARAAEGEAPAEPRKIWPFYAFDNGLGTIPTYEGKCQVLKELGFVGMEGRWNKPELPKLLAALDKFGLQLNAIYWVPMLDDPLPGDLAEMIALMKGRPTRIEMGIRSKTLKASDPAGDEKAAEMVKRVSDLCADTGPVVSFYPHTGFWTEKVEDGVRLSKLIGRKNVGTNFNLVHWYWVKPKRTAEEALAEALPHLKTVTINNGERNGRKIAPLDEGDYGVEEFMAAVKKVGYAGQVGLQCYSVPGPSEAHLKRSMAEWRRICAKLGVA